jgi:hypothetical protein
MHDARVIKCLMLAAATPVMAGGPWVVCVAQDRTAMQAAGGSYPVTASLMMGGQASLRADQAPKKNFTEPVLTNIAPEGRSQAIVLPERRSAIDQMLQSHEFTFGNGRAANVSGKRLSAGSAMDPDAVKLRVSRDKILLKAEWSFN